MAGLLNSNQQSAPGPAAATPPNSGGLEQAAQPDGKAVAAAGTDTLDDPLLKQAEQSIEDSVPPEHRQMYESIVIAGMNVMFSKDTASLIEQQLDEGGDLANNVSDGVAKLIMIVFNEVKQVSVDDFAPASVLAAVTLLCQALDYAEQSRGAQVTPEVLAAATKQTQMKVLKSFGITEEQVNQVATAGLQQGGGAPPAAGQPPAQPTMEA